MSKSWAVLCCVAAGWLVLASAQAQDAAQAGPTVAAPATAPPKALLLEAVRAYEAGDMESARVLFTRVHAQAPTARTLRSLGLVAYRQERFGDAVPLFEACLANELKPLTEEMRADVSGLLQEARLKLANDSAAPSTAPVVTSPAVEPAQVAEPSSVSRGEATRTTAPVGPATGPSSSKNRRLKRAGYTLLGLAGASLVVGGAAYLTGQLRLQRIAAHCRAQPVGQCSAADAADREHAARLDLLSKLSMASAILGSASAAGAATLLTIYYIPPAAGDTRQSVFGVTVQAKF